MATPWQPRVSLICRHTRTFATKFGKQAGLKRRTSVNHEFSGQFMQGRASSLKGCAEQNEHRRHVSKGKPKMLRSISVVPPSGSRSCPSRQLLTMPPQEDTVLYRTRAQDSCGSRSESFRSGQNRWRRVGLNLHSGG